MPPIVIAQLVLMFLSVLPDIIQSAEALFANVKNSGPQKRAHVLETLKKAMTLAAASDGKVRKALTPEMQGKIEELAGSAIDSTVALLNATVWKPEQPAPAAQ